MDYSSRGIFVLQDNKMRDEKFVKDRKYVLLEDAANRICEDLPEKECSSFACSDSKYECIHTDTRTFSKEALFFADTMLLGVEDELLDNQFADLFEMLDRSLEATNETLIAAHLNAFIWGVLYNINFLSFPVTADYASEHVQKRSLDAVRKALAELYEAVADE